MKKIVNSLMKKIPSIRKYYNDLLQDAKTYEMEAIKHYDKTKDTPLDIWINLYVNNKLRNKIRKFYLKNEVSLSEQVETEMIEDIEFIIEILDKLSLKDKVVLLEKIYNNKKVDDISNKYKIPIREVYTIEKNLISLFRYGEF